MADELFNKDPATYKEMAIPFSSAEATDAAMNAFHKELGELRKKYKVTNFVGVLNGEYINSQGELAAFMLPFFWGSAAEEEAMTAYLFGHAQSKRQDRIHEMLAAHKSIKGLKRER